MKLCKWPTHQPRGYQQEAIDFALQRNSIVFFPTGSGKTLVASCVMSQVLQKSDRKGVFLAPTTQLVEQQAASLDRDTELDVSPLHGQMDLRIGGWTAEMWKEFMADTDVIVATPRILLDAMIHGYVKISDFEILVMDECHHVSSRDVYAEIMNHFYKRCDPSLRPKILGLTAVVVKSKGNECVEELLEQVEEILDATVFTSSKVEAYQNIPTLRVEECADECSNLSFATQVLPPILPLVREIERMRQLAGAPSTVPGDAQEDVNMLESCFEDEFSDSETDPLMSLTPFVEEAPTTYLQYNVLRRLTEIRSRLMTLQSTCGMWGVRYALSLLIGRLPEDLENLELPPELPAQNDSVLRYGKDVAELWSQYWVDVEKRVSEQTCDFQPSPKLKCLSAQLKEHLSREHHDKKALVFVISRPVALVVSRYLQTQRLPCDFAVGAAGKTTPFVQLSAKELRSKVARFRQTVEKDRLDILVSTSVLCEGIDVASCSLAVHFDVVVNVTSEIQVEGRARSEASECLHLITKSERQTFDRNQEAFKQFRSVLSASAKRRALQPSDSQPAPIRLRDCYQAEGCIYIPETGAFVWGSDAKRFLWSLFYCLEPQTKIMVPQSAVPIKEKTHFKSLTTQHPETNEIWHICELTLPKLLNTTVEMPEDMTFRGKPQPSTALARYHACLKGIKALRKHGVLDDHLAVVGRRRLRGTADGEDFSLRGIEALDVAPAVSSQSLLVQSPRDGVALTVPPAGAGVHAESGAWSLPPSPPLHIHHVCLSHASAFTDPTEWNKPKANVQGLAIALTCRLDPPLTFELFVRDSKTPVIVTISATDQTTEAMSVQQRNSLVDFHRTICIVLRGGVQNFVALDAPDTQQAFYLFVPTDRDGRVDLEQARRFAAAHKNPIQFGDLDPGATLSDFTVARGYKIYETVSLLASTKSSLKRRTPDPPEIEPDDPLTTPLLPVITRVRNMLAPPKDPLQLTRSVESVPTEECSWFPLRAEQFRMGSVLPSLMVRLNHGIACRELYNKLSEQGLPTRESALITALTASSACPVSNYESLEFLGDAVLKAVVSIVAFDMPDMRNEGMLSEYTKRLETNQFLHGCSIRADFPKYLLQKNFSRRQWCPPLFDLPPERKAKYSPNLVQPKCVADLVEAILGTVYLGNEEFDFNRGMQASTRFCELYLDVQVPNPVPLPDNTPIDVTLAHQFTCLERELGYSFQHKALLHQAFTHRTLSRVESYERLEFLGDALVGCIAAKRLFSFGLSDAEMSDRKSFYVCNLRLSACLLALCRKANLSAANLIQIASERRHILIREENEWLGHIPGQGLKPTELSKEFADVFEALIGAVFLDSDRDHKKLASVFEFIFDKPTQLEN